MTHRAKHVVPVMLLLTTAIGCSFSDSSVSISKSISSPFTSSSASSPSAEAYQNDVADYTYAHVISSGQVDTFMKGLGSVAERHGVTNWEADDATYIGIGQGLGKAKFTQTQVDVFAKNVTNGDAKKTKLVQQGYDSARAEEVGAGDARRRPLDGPRQRGSAAPVGFRTGSGRRRRRRASSNICPSKPTRVGRAAATPRCASMTSSITFNTTRPACCACSATTQAAFSLRTACCRIAASPVNRIAVSDDTYALLRSWFNRTYLTEDGEFDALDALHGDRALIELLLRRLRDPSSVLDRDPANGVALRGAGYFFADGGESVDASESAPLAALRHTVQTTYGANFLQQRDDELRATVAPADTRRQRVLVFAPLHRFDD